MRYLGACVVALATTACWAVTEKDHVRKLHPLPDLTDSELRSALRRIDHDTVTLMESLHVPGLSMTIVKDGKVVWLKGYGYRNLEKKLPMTPDTITMIASCSKAFNSTLALMAVQDGKLSLDDPVRKYLPYFKLKDPVADAGMTIADLMCHSSGLPRTDQGWWTERLSAEESIRLLANCEPSYQFRENGQYSNVLVNTTSVITSQLANKSWSQLLKDRISGPLDMPSTSADPIDKLDKDRLSVGYWFNPLSGSVERERYDNVDMLLGAGGVKSTARDLSHWLQFHLNSGTYNGKRILDSAILAEAYKPRQLDGFGMGAFGLGWYTDDRWPVPLVLHGGDLQGFQSLVCLIPSKHIGIAFSDNNDDSKLRGPLLTKILENLIGKKDDKWDDQPYYEAGTFVNPRADHLLRTFVDGSLFAVIDQEKPIRLKRTGWRTYETADARNQPLSLCFSDDPKDREHPQVLLTTNGQTAQYKSSVKFPSGVTVEALLAKAVNAYGGVTALTQDLQFTGRFESLQHQEGLRTQGLMVRAGNDLGVMERLYDGNKYLATTLQGVNSASAAFVETNDRTMPALGSDLVDFQLDSQICQAFEWKSKFKKVEIIAKQVVNGQKAFVLRKIPRNSPTEILDFVSEESGLTLRRELSNPMSITEFGDFRSVKGVMLPHHLTTIDYGLHREDITIKDYVPTPRYLHWAFNPLGSAKTP